MLYGAMAMKVVAYYRVSTAEQGRSGLGLEAQRAAVAGFNATRGAEMLAEFTEVESGKRNDRPELAKAMHHANVTGATLVVAKLDRLSRDAVFLLTLRDSGAPFVAADNADVNSLTIGLLAVIAQDERERIAERTRVALAAAKARGQTLGNPNGAAAIRRAAKGNADAVRAVKAAADCHAAKLAPAIAAMREAGATSLASYAAALNERGMLTPRGGRWHPSSVRNLLARLSASAG